MNGDRSPRQRFLRLSGRDRNMTLSDLTTVPRSARRVRLRRFLPALILVVACGGQPVGPAPDVAGQASSGRQDPGERAVVEELGRGEEADRQVREFAGKVMPDPPNQGAAWTPPATKLPRSFVDETAVLFVGVADPRGCEYREVEVVGWRHSVQVPGVRHAGAARRGRAIRRRLGRHGASGALHRCEGRPRGRRPGAGRPPEKTPGLAEIPRAARPITSRKGPRRYSETRSRRSPTIAGRRRRCTDRR